MTVDRVVLCASVAIGVLVSLRAATAQGAEVFKARLTSLPVDAVTAPTMEGLGTVTATLTGNVLVIRGKFERLNSPAVAAHIHRAQRGMRGPNVFDLTATKATSGTVEGQLTLTAAQIENLNKGWYYVQIHTENNPDGHLRGWLLK